MKPHIRSFTSPISISRSQMTICCYQWHKFKNAFIRTSIRKKLCESSQNGAKTGSDSNRVEYEEITYFIFAMWPPHKSSSHSWTPLPIDFLSFRHIVCSVHINCNASNHSFIFKCFATFSRSVCVCIIGWKIVSAISIQLLADMPSSRGHVVGERSHQSNIVRYAEFIHTQ